jgi:hypothetical protein
MKPLKEFRPTGDARVWIGVSLAACLLAAQARELLAAELLFGIAFLFLALFGAIFYFAGDVAERGFTLTQARLRALAPRLRRTYRHMEGTTRR